MGGAPYDDEGVPTQKVVLLDKGVVKNFVYNLRWASKAGAKSTGHAARGYSSMPGIGPHSLYIENGTTPVEEIIKGLDRGFYLTDTGAFGYDSATGGWSYQASGLMIEKGAIDLPGDRHLAGLRHADHAQGRAARSATTSSSTAAPTRRTS